MISHQLQQSWQSSCSVISEKSGFSPFHPGPPPRSVSSTPPVEPSACSWPTVAYGASAGATWVAKAPWRRWCRWLPPWGPLLHSGGLTDGGKENIYINVDRDKVMGVGTYTSQWSCWNRYNSLDTCWIIGHQHSSPLARESAHNGRFSFFARSNGSVTAWGHRLMGGEVPSHLERALQSEAGEFGGAASVSRGVHTGCRRPGGAREDGGMKRVNIMNSCERMRCLEDLKSK